MKESRSQNPTLADSHSSQSSIVTEKWLKRVLNCLIRPLHIKTQCYGIKKKIHMGLFGVLISNTKACKPLRTSYTTNSVTYEISSFTNGSRRKSFTFFGERFGWWLWKGLKFLDCVQSSMFCCKEQTRSNFLEREQIRMRFLLELKSFHSEIIGRTGCSSRIQGWYFIFNYQTLDPMFEYIYDLDCNRRKNRNVSSWDVFRLKLKLYKKHTFSLLEIK